MKKTIAAGGIITILEAIQDKKGALSKEDLEKVSEDMNVPLSEVYGVATFYSGFKLSKASRHVIRVCDGTACHVKGSSDLISSLKHELGISAGESTPDGRFFLEVVRCLGACALAPAMRVDSDNYGKIKVGMISDILAKYK